MKSSLITEEDIWVYVFMKSDSVDARKIEDRIISTELDSKVFKKIIDVIWNVVL